MSEEAERIDAAMDAARIDLGLTWQEIADRAGIGTSSLNRFRRGIGPRTAEMTAKIERAYRWPRGYLDAIAAGEEPPPLALDPAARRIPTLDELVRLPMVDVLGVLDQVEKINGKAARDGLRNAIAAYLDRRARTVEPNGASEQAPAAT